MTLNRDSEKKRLCVTDNFVLIVMLDTCTLWWMCSRYFLPSSASLALYPGDPSYPGHVVRPRGLGTRLQHPIPKKTVLVLCVRSGVWQLFQMGHCKLRNEQVLVCLYHFWVRKITNLKPSELQVMINKLRWWEPGNETNVVMQYPYSQHRPGGYADVHDTPELRTPY